MNKVTMMLSAVVPVFRSVEMWEGGVFKSYIILQVVQIVVDVINRARARVGKVSCGLFTFKRDVSRGGGEGL